MIYFELFFLKTIIKTDGSMANIIVFLDSPTSWIFNIVSSKISYFSNM